MRLDSVAESAGNQISVLVVDSQVTDRESTVQILRGAGYDVKQADGFEPARRLLDQGIPALLVTSVRLGRFNGLHLIAKSRLNSSTMSAIVMHDALDPVLESHAREQNATYVVRPYRTDAFLELVRRSVTQNLQS